MQVPKNPGESFASYTPRPAAIIRVWIRLSGQTTLATMVFGAVHGWAGHLARLPGESPISRVLKYRNLEWWRETQLVLGKTDHLNRLNWRHCRPGQFARWEACLEKFDRRWINLAGNGDAWHSLKSRFVSSESLRLGCKNGSPDLANLGTQGAAKRSCRNGKRGQCKATPAPAQACPTLPVLCPLPPDPRPCLRPGLGPASAPLSPDLSLLSSLSAPLPTFWSAARLRDSLPEGVTLSCFTGSEDTIDMILCPRPPIDPQIYTLWKRVLGPLNAVAACVHSKAKNILLPSSSEELQRADHLATKAANTQSSSESDLTWPSLPFGTTDLHIRAYFSGSSKSGLGGAGPAIFLDYFGGSSELFSCGLYLGKRIPPNSALLQACGFTLLAVFPLLFRLSDNSRLY